MLVGVQCMELVDHVMRMCKVLCWQPSAVFCRVSVVLHAIAQDTLAVLALEDLLEPILLLTVYFDKRQRFGRFTQIGYLQLQQQDVKGVVDAASLL
jgi:hypothetical protein